MAINRMGSGIPGLDELINGGFPRESLILLSGSAGTGKTIFGLQSLCEGAKNNENGVYLTFEEPADGIIRCGDELGLGLKRLLKEKKIKIIDYAEFEEAEKQDETEEKIIKSRENRIFQMLKDSIDEIGAKRLVIDSLSSYMLYDGSKETLHNLIRNIRRLENVTTILVAELKESKEQLVEYLEGLESVEFMVDGIIVLDYIGLGGEEDRTVEVKKMRWTKQKPGAFSFEITGKGVKISTKISSRFSMK